MRVVITLVITVFAYGLLLLVPILALRISMVLNFFEHKAVFGTWANVHQNWEELSKKAERLAIVERENAQLKASGRFIASTTLGVQGIVIAVPGITAYDVVHVKTNGFVASGTLAWSSSSVPLGTAGDPVGSFVPVSWWSTPGRTTEIRIGEAPEILSAIGQGASVMLVEVPRGVFPVVVGDRVSLTALPMNPIGTITHLNDDPRDPYIRATITLFHSIWKTDELYFNL